MKPLNKLIKIQSVGVYDNADHEDYKYESDKSFLTSLVGVAVKLSCDGKSYKILLEPTYDDYFGDLSLHYKEDGDSLLNYMSELDRINREDLDVYLSEFLVSETGADKLWINYMLNLTDNPVLLKALREFLNYRPISDNLWASMNDADDLKKEQFDRLL